MRLTFFLTLFLLAVVTATAQSHHSAVSESGSPLTLSGKVTGVQVGPRRKSGYTPVRLSFEMEWRNSGSRPIILMNRAPQCLTAEMAGSLNDFETRKGTFSTYSVNVSADFVTAAQWSQFRRLMDQKAPPPDLTTTIPPGSSNQYSFNCSFGLPLAETSTSPYWIQMSLSQLREIRPLFIRFVGCDVRSYGIDERVDFAKKLQKRWNQQGFLWLNEVDSAPMPLNFNTATAISTDDPAVNASTRPNTVPVQDPVALCARLGEIKVLSFHPEDAEDPVYLEFVKAGDSAVPCLIEKITDATPTPDPREAPVEDTVIGDIAYFVLVRITALDFIEMLPDAVKADHKIEGVRAYFRYVASPQNRKELQTRLREWYRRSH